MFAQRYEVPETPEAFGPEMQRVLVATNKETAMETGDQFGAVWGGLGADNKQKIIDQTLLMYKKKYTVRPYLEGYFKAIVNAVNIEGIAAEKLTRYLNVTEKVIENYNGREFLDYLNTVSSFFEHHALYYNKANKLYVVDDSYYFEYVEQVYEEEVYVDPNEMYDENGNYIGPADENETWDNQEPFDSWDNQDQTWDTELYEEPLASEESYPDYVKPYVFIPKADGAVIRFEKASLNIVSSYDSVFLKNTVGFFSIKDKSFTGTGGRFDWTVDGLDSVEVYAELKDYTFDTRKTNIKAIDATITYPERLEQPVDGIFEFASVRHDSVIAARYPRFMSYESNLKIKDIGDEYVKYTGGFSLNGAKIYSTSFSRKYSKIEVMGEEGNKFVAKSYYFIFGDSTISADRAKMTIFHKRDSIYHPAVRFDYYINSRLLRTNKDYGKFKDTPYESSYFNMNFLTESLRWSMETDTMDIYVRQGVKVMPVVLESIDHFQAEDYRKLTSIYGFHLLGILVNYANSIGSDEFYLTDITLKHKITLGNLEGAIMPLMHKGLVDYDISRGLVTIKYRGRLLVEANFGRADYDNLIMESIMEEEPELPNASIYFNEEVMVVRGVEYMGVSDSMNVEIEPDSNKVILHKDRDIEFNGRITAGNFEYNGKGFTLEYDSFLVHMEAIDSVRFYTVDKNGTRRLVDNSMVGVDSTAGSAAAIAAGSAPSGTLYINDPDNKSGREHNPRYPNFNAGQGGVVYFNKRSNFNGVYDKSIFFVIPPFELDSLGGNDPGAIKFDGVFSSGGMFPDFEEVLEVQSDNSLGFYHEVPVEGYQLFEGSGVLYGDIKLNNTKGIRSNGQIDFLSTTLLSEDFTFYQDSVTGKGNMAEIREEDHNGVIFPQADLSNFQVKWVPQKDSMYVKNTADPFAFYHNTATLDGSAIISNNGVFGSGLFRTRGSSVQSKRLTLDHDNFAARFASFEVESNNPEKPVLQANGVSLYFSLVENYATIRPEREGDAVLEFPYAQFKTSIPEARWNLDQHKIIMNKPPDVPLENSYFYTTNKELDSLRFNATAAEYDIDNLELLVRGIPYIVVADAKITPENNEVLIHENSRIGTLSNTVIILDTLNGYHRLYDGVIDIQSRNSFSGHATYELVNALGDTFAIQMEDFRLEEFYDPLVGKGDKPVLHTVANGQVDEIDNILMSPGMYYKGDVKLEAHNIMLKLDGYIKLNLLRSPGYDTWIRYEHSADQEKIAIDFDNSVTEDGRILEAGLYFSSEDNNLYSLFIDMPRGISDELFFRPSGNLYYDEEKQEFVIESPAKAAGESFSGKVFTYNENTSEIRFEGPVEFFEGNKDVNLNASMIGRGNTETEEFNLNTFMAIDFNVPPQGYDLMAQDIVNVVKNLGAPEGLGDPTDLLYKVAEIMGEKATKAYEERTLQEYVSLAGFSKQTSAPLVFADVNMKWSKDYHAFYSEGLLGMSNMLGYDINGAFEGFMEIKRNEDGTPVFNLFLKASADSWYFFGYEDNRLLMFSSNPAFNGFVSKKSNAAKAKIGELVFLPGDQTEVLSYINRFRQQYYGIEGSYNIGADAVLNDTEKKEEEVEKKDADDGF